MTMPTNTVSAVGFDGGRKFQQRLVEFVGS